MRLRPLRPRLLALACAALATVGCDAEPVANGPSPLHVLTVPATKGTAARFGITRWHVLEQRGEAYVFDGTDAKGRVRVAVSLREEGGRVRVTSYTRKGTMVLDPEHGTATGGASLGLRFARTTTAFLRDQQKAGLRYNFWGPRLPMPRWLPRLGPRLGPRMSRWSAKEAAKDAANDLAQRAADRVKEAERRFEESPSAESAAQLEDAKKRRDEANEAAEKALRELEEAKKEAVEELGRENVEASAKEQMPEVASLDADQASLDERTEGTEEAEGVAEAEALGPEAGDEPAEDPAAEDGAADESADGEDTGDALPEEESSEDLDASGLDEVSEADDEPAAAEEEGGDDSGEAQARGRCRKTVCGKTTRVCVCSHY